MQTQVHTRADGSTLLRSTDTLQPYPQRLSDRLLHYGEQHAQRSFVARRRWVEIDQSGQSHPGEWVHISYGQMLQRARAVGQWLLQNT